MYLEKNVKISILKLNFERTYDIINNQFALMLFLLDHFVEERFQFIWNYTELHLGSLPFLPVNTLVTIQV